MKVYARTREMRLQDLTGLAIALLHEHKESTHIFGKNCPKKSNGLQIKDLQAILVAEAGLEPTTFGL
jgi:hypothetical protein